MRNGDPDEILRGPAGQPRLLFDSITGCAIHVLDETGRVIAWSAEAERLEGYDETEIIGEPVSRLYTEEDRAADLPHLTLWLALEEGRFEREGWRVRKDGTRFWAFVGIDPIRTPSGELVGYAEIVRDLTHRKTAEDALRRSEQQFRLLVQGVTDYAIYMLDRSGHISSWNVGAERIKGYRPDEIIGRHFAEFYAPEDRAAGIPAAGLAAAARDGRWEHEGWRVRKDGSRFWAHVILDAIIDEGELVGFVKVTRDVTERMKAQRDLEVAREALFQAQKMEAIGQLTGGIAHDFNNLLMVVLGSLELLRKRMPPDPRLSPLVENAIQGAQRGASLTQRMLAFARKQELRIQAVDLATLVRGMLDLLRRAVGPVVQIVVDIPPGLPHAGTDPNQLEAAILNLTVNARDAMPEGGTITISARAPGEGDREAGYVCLAVRDTGLGMDAATLARAAEPFFTTKDRGKGTGLGLPMVHGLAQQSGGRLALRSRPGEGTTAELWFPVAEAAGEPGPLAGAAANRGPDAARLRVLVVDDDGLVLANTAALLEDLGHIVLRAESGSEALQCLAEQPGVDIVITDHAMPHMTGAQLREVIWRQRPHLPVLITTGYADVALETIGDLSRLMKPFTQAELAGAIAATMHGGPPLGATAR